VCLRAAPILKPEPADADKLPRIVCYDFESPARGTSRKQQVIGPYGVPWLFRLAGISDAGPFALGAVAALIAIAPLAINPKR
jgi:hypothetical protein